ASHDSCRCSPGHRSFLTLQRGNACRDAPRHKPVPRSQFRSVIKTRISAGFFNAQSTQLIFASSSPRA
ncbi:DUF1534 domain-containing protein, partial [Pseudomonas syringae pv. actinidiae]|nr:DUF1534 domain-containing protein [Pseudomonas syringae pv. actinidiae]